MFTTFWINEIKNFELLQQLNLFHTFVKLHSQRNGYLMDSVGAIFGIRSTGQTNELVGNNKIGLICQWNDRLRFEFN